MNTFCTIVTDDYLPMALALYDSLRENGDASLHILVSSKEDAEYDVPEGVHINNISDLMGFKNTAKLFEKYYMTDANAFRWSVKPEYISYLIKEKGFGKVIYIDADTYFFGAYEFLFDMLNENDVLLTPHWRSFNPAKSPLHFHLNFTEGFFNGGFIAASSKGLGAMDWLSGACLYECRQDTAAGLFYDQKYLDALPVMFEGVRILRHKGCNVASWNIHECPRTVHDGRILIDGVFPLVFVHFSRSTVNHIFYGKDDALYGCLEKYLRNLDGRGFTGQSRLYVDLDGILDSFGNASKISSFGYGESGRAVVRFLQRHLPGRLVTVVDDNVKDADGLRFMTTEEFLAGQDADIIVFGRHQALNPALLNNLTIPYIRMEQVG